MNTVIYLALTVGVVILLASTIRKKDFSVDSKIDIVAYSIMLVGLIMLDVATVYEAVTGSTIVG